MGELGRELWSGENNRKSENEVLLMMLARTGKLHSGVTRMLSALFPPQTPTRRQTSIEQNEGLPMKVTCNVNIRSAVAYVVGGCFQ